MSPALSKKVFGTSHEREIRKLVAQDRGHQRPRGEHRQARWMEEPGGQDARAQAKAAKKRRDPRRPSSPRRSPVCREAGKGILKMRHYDVQPTEAWSSTGGATAPRCAPARARPSWRRCLAISTCSRAKGVHVVTVNDLPSPGATASGTGKPLRISRDDGSGAVVHSQSEQGEEGGLPPGRHQRKARTTSTASTTCAGQHEVQLAGLRPAPAQLTPSSTRSTPSSSTRRARRSSSAARASPRATSTARSTRSSLASAKDEDTTARTDEKAHSVTLTDDERRDSAQKLSAGIGNPLRSHQPRVAPDPGTSASARTLSTSATSATW